MGKMRAAALMFVVLLLLASSSEASLMDGLVGYWSLDNCDVNDYSGNANDGILHGEPQFVDGISGSAISLNGNGDFIDIPIALEGSISGFTFSAWVNTDTLAVNASRKVIHTGILGEGQLDVSNGSFSFAVKLTDNYWYQVQAPAAQNQWVFLVGQYSRGDTIRLYVNGELGKSMMVPDYSLHTAWDLYSAIGARHTYDYAVPGYWSGMIDEVRIYDRVISEAEIDQLYSSISPVPEPSTILLLGVGIVGVLSLRRLRG